MSSGNHTKPTLITSASVRRYVNKHKLQITNDGVLHIQRYLERHLDVLIKKSNESKVTRLNAMTINEIQKDIFNNDSNL